MPVGRRRFVQGAGLAGLGLLAACARLPGQAPPAPKIPRVGFFTTGAAESRPGGPFHDAFIEGLREQGYEEGQNVVVERRYSAVPEEWPDLAAELVRLPVDIIVAPPTITALPAMQATRTIPIVFVHAGDPIGEGLVDNLARPSGNVTGLASFFTLLGQKRLELLKETAPRISRVASLYHAADPSSVAAMQAVVEAAHPLALTVEALAVDGPEDFASAFDAATRLRADALLTTQGPLLVRNAQRIVDFAASARLPGMYHLRSYVDAGGLMTYGPDTAVLYRRAAYYVDRLLKGAKPADLPVEQPMRFEFIINLKTAQALGLTVHQHVLLQATEVIQ